MNESVIDLIIQSGFEELIDSLVGVANRHPELKQVIGQKLNQYNLDEDFYRRFA